MSRSVCFLLGGVFFLFAPVDLVNRKRLFSSCCSSDEDKDMLEDIEVMFYNFPFAVQQQRGFR